MPKATKERISDYLRIVSDVGVCPNFWMSEEYIDKARLEWVKTSNGLSGFKDNYMDDEWFFPPIRGGNFVLNENIYSGFLITNPPIKSNFLDYQFIYQSSNFLDLSGGKWAVFRKNIKKYQRRIRRDLHYRTLQPDEQTQRLEALLLKWAQDKKIYDPEVMVRFVMEGNNREALFAGGELVGLNVFDENHWFVNFRYCLDDGSPFLNELMRYLFYINRPATYVNDGGSLNNPTLHAFKVKLNPFLVYKIYSYRKGYENENK